MYAFEIETTAGKCVVTLAAKDWNDFAHVEFSGDDAAKTSCKALLESSCDPFGHFIVADTLPPCDINHALITLEKTKADGFIRFSLIHGEPGVIKSPPFKS